MENNNYECPVCRDAGYVLSVDEYGYSYAEPCKCRAIKESRERLKSSGLAKEFKGKTRVREPGPYGRVKYRGARSSRRILTIPRSGGAARRRRLTRAMPTIITTEFPTGPSTGFSRRKAMRLRETGRGFHLLELTETLTSAPTGTGASRWKWTGSTR